MCGACVCVCCKMAKCYLLVRWVGFQALKDFRVSQRSSYEFHVYVCGQLSSEHITTGLHMAILSTITHPPGELVSVLVKVSELN